MGMAPADAAFAAQAAAMTPAKMMLRVVFIW
jgi:hypothetical protein